MSDNKVLFFTFQILLFFLIHILNSFYFFLQFYKANPRTLNLGVPKNMKYGRFKKKYFLIALICYELLIIKVCQREYGCKTCEKIDLNFFQHMPLKWSKISCSKLKFYNNK